MPGRLTCRKPFGSGGNRVKTFPPVQAKCSFMRSGYFCSFPPGLCSRESQPVANMSSGEAATDGVAAADVDALGALASYRQYTEMVSDKCGGRKCPVDSSSAKG